jgi:murein DD-endopeptidase MepM/ murein hydrolase activator NlpD
VKKGQYVNKGSVIAKMGSTGNATGPHLHFEIRSGGKPVNPISYLK